MSFGGEKKPAQQKKRKHQGVAINRRGSVIKRILQHHSKPMGSGEIAVGNGSFETDLGKTGRPAHGTAAKSLIS